MEIIKVVKNANNIRVFGIRGIKLCNELWMTTNKQGNIIKLSPKKK